MNIILLSGGGGKRLWPLSNDIRSKQFIKIFRDDTGYYQSMVQRVYKQICTIDPDAFVMIATSKQQVSSIRNQLNDKVEICVEPCRRDTFPAIALAAAYLHDVKNMGEHEVVVVCPVDPYVEIEYFEAIRQLVEIVKTSKGLTLMGVEPTYPSEKYGYIIPENNKKISKVCMFKEKPDRKTAERYLRRGALWNAGVFAFHLGYVLEKARELIDYTDYADLYYRYETLNKISFDYAVAEQEDDIQVVRFQGQWKDLGTWNTLTEAMEEHKIGKAILDDTCQNVHIINEMEVPVLCMGMKNTVISASQEGILVSDKDRSGYIKNFVEQIDQQIMFAEKSWGDFKVLDIEKNSMTIKISVNAGHRMDYHSHDYRDEVWNVISGIGKAVVDGMTQPLKPGDVITIESGCRHTIMAESDMKLIELQIGDNIDVADKRKYDLDE